MLGYIVEQTRGLFHKKKGGVVTEYAVLIALIATAIFLTITALGEEVSLIFQRAVDLFP